MPVRSIENQAALMRHRARELLAGQRTAALNALRGHLAEIGVVAPQGAQHAYGLKRMAADGFNENGEIVVPDCVRVALVRYRSDRRARRGDRSIDSELAASVKADETAKRLMTIPGVGPARLGDRGHDPGRRRIRQRARVRRLPRPDAAPDSTGGKTRLGRITKMGDRYLRKLGRGRRATLRHRRGQTTPCVYGRAGAERKTANKFNLTAVALANKVARIIFVLMTRGGQYDDRPVAA